MFLENVSIVDAVKGLRLSNKTFSCPNFYVFNKNEQYVDFVFTYKYILLVKSKSCRSTVLWGRENIFLKCKDSGCIQIVFVIELSPES